MNSELQQEKYDELELDAYREHLSDIWNIFFKVKKFRMYTTGSASTDMEVYRICGMWWCGLPGFKKGIQQLRERESCSEEDIRKLEEYVKEAFPYMEHGI